VRNYLLFYSENTVIHSYFAAVCLYPRALCPFSAHLFSSSHGDIVLAQRYVQGVGYLLYLIPDIINFDHTICYLTHTSAIILSSILN
jgi:hypothetical protein